jgi:hypothetical protein
VLCQWWNCTSPFNIWIMSWWSTFVRNLATFVMKFSSPLLWCHRSSKCMIKRWSTYFWGLSSLFSSLLYFVSSKCMSLFACRSGGPVSDLWLFEAKNYCLDCFPLFVIC